MAPFRFDLPDINEVYALADWFEIMFLLSGKTQISRVKISDVLVAKIGSTPQEIETPLNFLFAEITRRRRIAGEGYPLFIDGTLIKLDPQSNSEFYKFLLLVSQNGPVRIDKKFKEIDQLFDELVCEAVKKYFGDQAQALRFGWPPSGGRPKKFTDALRWLSDQTGMPTGQGKPGIKTLDGGVDVVVWKPFSDNRTAFVLALIQCTFQADWFPKGKDVIGDIWLSRVDTGKEAITSLAIPFVIPKNFDKWDDLRRTVNIVFDRLRLAEFLSQCDASSFTKMISWSKKEIARYSI